MSPLEQLTQKIIKAVPSIVELKFGCQINCLDYPGMEAIRTYVGKDWNREFDRYDIKVFDKQIYNIDKKFEILGRPILLEDVLIALGNDSQTDSEGKIAIIHYYTGKYYSYVCDWLLNTPLHLQSEETISEINKLIK